MKEFREFYKENENTIIGFGVIIGAYVLGFMVRRKNIVIRVKEF